MSKKTIVIGGGGSLLQKENGHIIDSFDYVVRMGDCKIKGYEKYIGTKTDMFRVVWKNHYCLQQGDLISDSNTILFKDTEVHGFRDLLITEYADSDEYYEFVTHIPRQSFYRWLVYDFKSNFSLRYCGTKQRARSHRHTRILYDMMLKNFLLHHPEVQNVIFYNKKHKINLATDFCKGKQYITPTSGICTINHIVNTRADDAIFITGFDGFKHGYAGGNNTILFDNHSVVHERMYLRTLLKRGIVREL